MSEQKPINCEEALQRLFVYIDRELGAHQHDEMERHLATCRSCFSRLEFERRLKAHLKSATRERAPAELQGKIKLLIHKL